MELEVVASQHWQLLAILMMRLGGNGCLLHWGGSLCRGLHGSSGLLGLVLCGYCDWKAVACCCWVTAPVWYNSNTLAGVRVHHRDTGALLDVGAIHDLDSVSSSQVDPALASDSDAPRATLRPCLVSA